MGITIKTYDIGFEVSSAVGMNSKHYLLERDVVHTGRIVQMFQRNIINRL
jgi:hypothetical protein